MKRPLSTRSLVLLLTAVLMVSFILSISSGRVPIQFSDMIRMASTFFQNPEDDLMSKDLVFLWIRLPRCLMAVLAGSSLAVTGAVYQALFRNPLVSPDILGVSAGCTFGAALGLVLPFNSIYSVHFLSFGFGLMAVALSMGLARVISIKPVIILVLAGMVVMSFFNALLMVVKYFSDPYDELPGIIYWVMGSLSRITWDNVLVMAPFAAAGLFLFILLGFRLNILSMGDIQARSLGMNPSFFRMILITASSFMVAVCVATCGQIAWIGLVIPHLARTLAGPEHERMIPVSALLGGIFLLLADSLARTLSSAEIPVGIITALTGAPVFAWFMFRNRSSGWI
ncbi:MAG: iron ABC transporter permease [Desulfobacula sp.]|nr:iron ABC transporter permease [Desulfobacula sp.]